jgi:succinoglycan biosynthesis transport protein ExoP
MALGASLLFVWLRPAEYRAAARIEITPAAIVSSAPIISSQREPASPFLTEVQVMTSRPVLEDVAARLARDGRSLSQFGSDAAAGMEARLEALPVPNTNVVELIGTGRDAEILAPLINATIEAYRDHLGQTYQDASSQAMSEADDEVKKLEAAVLTKRRDLEAFRLRHDIVSLERGENPILAQVRNLATSLAVANEKVATAEGKLRALTESVAAGKPVARARDDAMLTNLEQRASQAREELRDMERIYTQEYLSIEPKATTLRARLSDLERQIPVQREASQKAAIVEAQQELATATAAAARLQAQIGAGKAEVGQFTGRYNELKSRQDDLTELEKTYREATQKRARLEASERARMPAARLIEAASTPHEPWSPPYWRDTGIAAGGSLVLALLAMWLVELFNRTEPQPGIVMVRPQMSGMSYEGSVDDLPRQGARVLERPEPPLIAAQPALPRELERAEVTALLQASDELSRIAILLLLSGFTAEEAVAARIDDVDFARGAIRIRGPQAREVAVGDILRAALAARAPNDAGAALMGQSTRLAARESVDAHILCAAHDAGLEDPTNVDAACLRHTYVAYLVRQGIRFADLSSLVGELPAPLLGAYTRYAPPGPRVPRERIDMSYPGLRANVSG